MVILIEHGHGHGHNVHDKLERWASGLCQRFAKVPIAKAVREFESLSLRINGAYADRLGAGLQNQYGGFDSHRRLNYKAVAL